VYVGPFYTSRRFEAKSHTSHHLPSFQFIVTIYIYICMYPLTLIYFFRLGHGWVALNGEDKSEVFLKISVYEDWILSILFVLEQDIHRNVLI